MPELPLRIQSAGLAIERRGARARIAGVVFTVAFVVLAASLWILFSTYTPSDSVLLTLCVSLPSCLASASVLLQHRFQAPRSAAPGDRARGEVLLGEAGVSAVIRRVTRSYGPGRVVDGWIDEPGEVTSVVLRMRGGDVISIEVPTLLEARAVLLAAGVAAEQQVLKMRLANAMTQLPVGGCIAALGSFFLPIAGIIATIGLFASPMGSRAQGTSALILAAITLVFALLVRALIPPRVVIGTDGIAVERMFGRTFVRHSRVTEVSSRRGAVVLQVRGGRSLALPTGHRYASLRSRAEESPHTALRNRIEEARAAGRSRSSPSACAADLDRGGRSLDAWRRHLRGLVSTESYRRASVGKEEIAAVLEDASAPPQRRVAAALILAEGDDAAIKLRIADVVRTCADESLRAALEAAAQGEITEADLSPLLRRRRELG
jgi:Bacterial PH domain